MATNTSTTGSSSSEDAEMTPEQRLEWLREHGVMVETAEDRRQKEIRDIMKEPDIESADNGVGGYTSFSYVLVPADEGKPTRELTLVKPSLKPTLGWDAEYSTASHDLLPEHLRSYFSAKSPHSLNDVDLSLLREQAAGGAVLGTDNTPTTISDEALRKAASESSVEVFPLVRPCQSNKFCAVNVYLDEVGMLKRLPLNRRASKLAERAGFDPPPNFYGDVFLGRVERSPRTGGRESNTDFRVGEDTNPDASWLRTAAQENLEHQIEMNAATGRAGETMPGAYGTDGEAKIEAGGAYSWTQDDEEIEVTVKFAYVGEEAANSRDVAVVFKSQSISVKFRGVQVLNLELFASVDVDGCTWTLERGEGEVRVVTTCEKTEAATWPRIGR